MHASLEQFAADAAARLALAAHSGDEVPFEVVASDVRGAHMPFYCYRPLTGRFVCERLALLTALPAYEPAAHALQGVGGIAAYLHARGGRSIAHAACGDLDLALCLFIARVFEDRNDFTLESARFERAYEELERVLYQGRCVTELVVPLLGIDLDPSTAELQLGEGLSIVRPKALADAPADLVHTQQAPLLLALRIAHERSVPPSPAFAHGRLRRVLSTLRLYQRGSYLLGPLGYSRLDDGPWSAFALGTGGQPRRLTLIAASEEDELRDFCNLLARRLPPDTDRRLPDNSGAGEVAWALDRFEMGCERNAPFQALTDYLLALMALFEPEGPASGRLAGRLAVICARPEERVALTARVARADALERRVMTGTARLDLDLELLVEELAEHLRAVLRDVICGHLDADVRALADALIDEEASRLLAA